MFIVFYISNECVYSGGGPCSKEKPKRSSIGDCIRSKIKGISFRTQKPISYKIKTETPLTYSQILLFNKPFFYNHTCQLLRVNFNLCKTLPK